jgi:hypothetical protein
MVANPFFLFKNRPSQSYDPYSRASIDVKTGSSDSADFAMTRLLIQIYPLAYCPVTAEICQWLHNHCANCQSRRKWTTDLWQFEQKTRWQFAQWLCNHWHIAVVTVRYAKGLFPICHRWGSRSRAVAKSPEPVLSERISYINRLNG